MLGLKDWLQKKMQQREEKFARKLEKSTKFSDQEKQTIERHIHRGEVQEIVHVFFIFLVWSGIFSILDVIIFLFSLGISVAQESANFWPFFIFLILNGLAKLWYAHISLLRFSWLDKALSTLPYVGAGLLLAKGLKNEPLTKKALWMFLKKKL